MKYSILAVVFATAVSAAQIPAGTEVSIRLTDKVTSEATTPQQSIHAAVIASVSINGHIVLPPGSILTGTVKQAKAATDTGGAQLQLVFTEISDGKTKASIATVVSALENSRETVDASGVITGIDPSKAYGTRLNQGISKLQGNEKLAGFASVIQGAKQALRVEDVNANVDYDPGVEMTLKLTAPLDWKGSIQGPEAKLRPFAEQAALRELVNRQPFRTVAAKPPKESDMTNLMFVGTEEEVRAAFIKAGWSSAAKLSAQSKLETARAMIEDRGYKEGPMSVLLLDNQPPDMAWQKGNNTFSQRHHLRIFRRPDTFAGKPVWVCSSTHDTGIDFSEKDRTFIHKVDSKIDSERAKVVADLLFTDLVKSVTLVDRPDVPKGIQNATGDSLQTDGRMAVLLF